jgi:hypothetical protein
MTAGLKVQSIPWLIASVFYHGLFGQRAMTRDEVP